MLGTIFVLTIGVAIGYIFKPQLDKVVIKAVKYIKDKKGDDTFK